MVSRLTILTTEPAAAAKRESITASFTSRQHAPAQPHPAGQRTRRTMNLLSPNTPSRRLASNRPALTGRALSARNPCHFSLSALFLGPPAGAAQPRETSGKQKHNAIRSAPGSHRPANASRSPAGPVQQLNSSHALLDGIQLWGSAAKPEAAPLVKARESRKPCTGGTGTPATRKLSRPFRASRIVLLILGLRSLRRLPLAVVSGPVGAIS